MYQAKKEAKQKLMESNMSTTLMSTMTSKHGGNKEKLQYYGTSLDFTSPRNSVRTTFGDLVYRERRNIMSPI